MTKVRPNYEKMYGDFFAYATERERIRIRKESGESHPLTEDVILQNYRFCNVFREDDATTRWFATVRDKLPPDQVLLATVLFRWFNRIQVGDAIFKQLDVDGATAFESLVRTGGSAASFRRMQHAVVSMVGKKGPFVTGSYIIKGWDGLPKLPGVLRCVEEFMRTEYDVPLPGVHDKDEVHWGWEQMTDWMLRNPGHVSLEQVHGWLAQHRYLGGFMAYEVVTDLYQTALLRNAPDIGTWANPGPGAARGLNRIFQRPLTQKSGATSTMLNEMRDILKASRHPALWPFAKKRPWDMRTVEHTLCEFDKYERTRLGEGRPRQTYKAGR